MLDAPSRGHDLKLAEAHVQEKPQDAPSRGHDLKLALLNDGFQLGRGCPLTGARLETDVERLLLITDKDAPSRGHDLKLVGSRSLDKHKRMPPHGGTT